MLRGKAVNSALDECLTRRMYLAISGQNFLLPFLPQMVELCLQVIADLNLVRFCIFAVLSVLCGGVLSVLVEVCLDGV